jgi:CheY-like chemotaxis protein
MTTGTNGKPIQVLLVEDNPADARLAEETIKGSSHQVNVTVAEDGEVAMAILHKEGEYANAERPDLILLDLRLPKKDGSEVLAEINADAELVSIPVMILTGTEAEQSLLNSYNIPPSRYWRKPVSLNRFDMALNQLSTLRQQPIVMDTPPSSRGEPVGAGVGGDDDRRKKWWWPF